MKRFSIILLALIASSTCFVGCSRTARDDKNVAEMENGQVVEIEGPQDQYGWFPHMRLTFDGDQLVEVYYDYVDDSAAKKSQDEEYNSTMQEKTGTSVKDAMETLRANLLETQDPDKVDIVAGATQTSTEFIEMAKQAFDNYKNGKTSANNYGESKEQTEKQSESGSSSGGEASGQTGNATGNTGQPSAEKSASPYITGGDGNPNSQGGSSGSQGASQDAVPVGQE